jgi:BioD-like phosphotransacetylase family protein
VKAVYITSIEDFSGKTAVCLGLGKRLQAEGYRVGYLKPVSYEATQLAGKVVDEDVLFAKNVLALTDDPQDLSPVVVTPSTLADCLGEDNEGRLKDQITGAARKVGEGKDLLILEGGGSLRMGYAIGLSTPYVAEMLDADMLVVIRYAGRMRMLDDALTAHYRIGDRLLGVIFNRVPADAVDFTSKEAVPFLEGRGVRVLGILPERPSLASISIQELIDTLDAEMLTTRATDTSVLVEHLMVGAMRAEEAVKRFQRIGNKAVITGGDRTDVQLAALETSTACLILTGNLQPRADVLERANETGVCTLLVKTNTLETVQAIDEVFGKTRLGQADKLALFEALMAETVDYKRLLGLLKS